MAHRSARPAPTIVLAWSMPWMPPTAMTGMPVAWRMRSAKGTWYMRP